MIDIQSQLDHRRVNIKKVGVKTIDYPVSFLDKENNHQHTIASLNMYVNLPHKFKGTHMSRFVEILNQVHGEIDPSSFKKILEEMKLRLDAEASHLEMSFPYFLQKDKHGESLRTCRYECQMHGSLEQTDELEFRFKVPIFRSLNSEGYKGMSRSRGQWGNSIISVRFKKFIWIEDLIMRTEEAIADTCRQADEEKRNYSVELLTEKISENLSTQKEIKWYSVEVENLGEGYSTFAILEGGDTINSTESL